MSRSRNSRMSLLNQVRSRLRRWRIRRAIRMLLSLNQAMRKEGLPRPYRRRVFREIIKHPELELGRLDDAVRTSKSG